MIQNIYRIIILTIILASSESWKSDKLPKIYGDKLPSKLISPHIRKNQKRIVMLHDYFRTKVSPPAANMLSMKWHKGAAKNAQKWAESCELLIHDPPQSRWIENYGACGQNIFVSSHKVPWMFALKSWFIERHNFTYGSNNNNLKVVGHYTQMVWAATHKVGCGLAKCMQGGPGGKLFYNYVCNYCPIGNWGHKLGTPYKRGRPCGSCRRSCTSKKIPLCNNACKASNQWSNCEELYKTWPAWLCETATIEGEERKKNCLATCKCRGKIYDK